MERRTAPDDAAREGARERGEGTGSGGAAAPVVARAVAPALAVACVLGLGASLGGAAAGASGALLPASVLGWALFRWVQLPERGRDRWVLAALLALAALRAASPQPPASAESARTPRPIAGRATPASTQRAYEQGQRWHVATAAGSQQIVVDRGALRPGEAALVLSTARAGRRAAGTAPARPGPPLPSGPRADELVRAAGRDDALAQPSELAAAAGSLAGPLARLRRRGLARAQDHPDPTTRGLLCALLFGDTSQLPPGVADLFTRTGTRHMLALSGLHVGILGALLGLPLARSLAGLCNLLARSLRLRVRVPTALPLAGMALLFVPMAGHGAPAARAAVALSLAALGPTLPGGGRRPSGANLLGLALVIELAVDPLATLRPGVQLSYLATAALITVAPRATVRALASWPGRGLERAVGSTGRPRPWALRIAGTRMRQALVIGIVASLVASAATLPVVWTTFGEWSPIGVLATPLAMPPLVVLLVGGWVWMALPGVVGDATLSWASHALLALLQYADRVPASPCSLPDRHVLLVALACALALWAARQQPGSSLAAARAAALLGGALLLPTASGAKLLEVHVCDVGAGTAIVARAPGSSTWLFDAGSRDRKAVATGAVAPILRHMDVGRIHITLSHDHADHASALPWLARRFRVDRWIGPPPTMAEDPWLSPPLIPRTRRQPIPPGVTRLSRVDDHLQVFAIRGRAYDRNEGSSLLDLRWHPNGVHRVAASRVVLCGDAEGDGLDQILDGKAPWLEAGPIDALLLPHHGSSSAHCARLLDHLRPSEAWVSASAPPQFRDEFARRGICVRVTSEVGAFQWRSGSKPGDVQVDGPRSTMHSE